MSYEVMAYEKARLDYSEAETELAALTATVKAAATTLELDPLSIDAPAWPWPSSEQIASVLAKVRAVRQELRDTWAAVPEEMRSDLEPPPEGSLEPYSVAREVGIRLRDTGAVGSCVELNALRCRRAGTSMREKPWDDMT